MATPASTEASEIRRRGRRRLIGAVTLVVLAVVFVPMVLDSEPRPKRNEAALEIPAKDTVPPLPAPAPASAGSVTPVETGAQKTSAKAAPPKVEVASPKLEGFAVQVGAFRDEDKLRQAREKLASAGLAHYVERRGDLNRLRAGPYPTREAAEKALATVKSASLDGQVVPLP
jgi:DedD protein